jgi:hypothetical protein
VELLPEALKWLLRQQTEFRSGIDEFETLSLAITKLAWENLHVPKVAALLARVAEARMKRASNRMPIPVKQEGRFEKDKIGLTREEFVAGQTQRMILAKAWLEQFGADGGRNEAYHLNRFAFDLDEWILDELESAAPEHKETLLASANQRISYLIYNHEEERLKRVEARCGSLGIDIAQHRIDAEEYRQSQEEPHRVKPGFSLRRLLRRISAALVAKGSYDQYSRLLTDLQIGDRGWPEGRDDLVSAWPGWQRLTVEQKSSLVEWSKAIILSILPTLSGWDLKFQERMGLTALILVAELDSQWCEAHSKELKAWMPLLISHFYTGGSSSNGRKPMAATLPIFQLPGVRAGQIAKVIEARETIGESPLNVSSFSDLWNPQVGKELGSLISQGRFGKPARGKALGALVLNSDPAVLSLLMGDSASGDNSRVEVALDLALTMSLGETFEEISKLALADQGVFDKVWDLFWNRPMRHARNLDKLTTPMLMALLDRAVTVPLPPEPRRNGPFSPTLEDDQRSLRHDFASALAKKNDPAGWQYLIERSVLPNLESFAWIAHGAEREWIENSWHPPLVANLIRLKTRQDGRYLVTQQDLLDATCAALERLGPRFEHLDACWTDTSRKKPLNEPALTGLLATLLEYELNEKMVVNMEVKCVTGGRTDIQIEAQAENGKKRLQCVIEAKKDSNPELKDAVPMQLAGTYLSENTGATGVFLVLRFKKAKRSQEQWIATRIRLETQAGESGSTIRIVDYQMGRNFRTPKGIDE